MIDENNNVITFSMLLVVMKPKKMLQNWLIFCEIQLNFKSLEAEYLEV